MPLASQAIDEGTRPATARVSRPFASVRSLSQSHVLRRLSWIGLVLLVLGAAFIYYYPSHEGADLIPDPDATEYAMVGLNVLHGHGLTFTVNGVDYPSRYPFGFPLILSAFYLISGQFVGHAIFVVCLSAIGTVVIVYLLMRKIASPVAAFVAGATVLSSVLFRNWSQSVLSDHTSVLLFCLLSFCTYYLLAKRKFHVVLAIWYVAVCTFLIWIRFIDIVVVFANMALLGYAIWRKYIAVKYTIAIGAAIAMGLIPTFIYNYLTFGSLMGTGYSYWVPAFFKNIHDALAFKYFRYAHAPTGYLFEPNYRFYARELIGRGTYFPAFVLVLALVGALTFLVRFRRYSVAKRMTLTFVALGWCLYMGTYALYFWQADRFLIPAVPMISIFVGICVDEYFLKWFGARATPARERRTVAVSLPKIGIFVRARRIRRHVGLLDGKMWVVSLPKVGVFLRLSARDTTLRIARTTATVLVSLALALFLYLSGVQAFRTVVQASYLYRESIDHAHGIYGIRYDTYKAMNLHCPSACVIVSVDDPAFVNYVVPHAYVINAGSPFYEDSIDGPTATNQGAARLDKVRDAVLAQIPVLYDQRMAGFAPNARKEMLRYGDEKRVEASRTYNVYQIVPRTSGNRLPEFWSDVSQSQ